jgi:hypothetical protein
MLNICLEGAIHFILNRPPKNDGSADFKPLKSEGILGTGNGFQKEEVPYKAYNEIITYLSEVRWRISQG